MLFKEGLCLVRFIISIPLKDLLRTWVKSKLWIHPRTVGIEDTV